MLVSKCGESSEDSSPTESLGSVRPVTESPVYKITPFLPLWLQPTEIHRVGDVFEATWRCTWSNPRCKRGRSCFLWLFNSGQLKQQVKQQVRQWNSAPCHSLITVPGNQTFIEQKPARWKPFLSTTPPPKKKNPSPGHFFDSLCQYL